MHSNLCIESLQKLLFQIWAKVKKYANLCKLGKQIMLINKINFSFIYFPYLFIFLVGVALRNEVT